MSPAGALSTMKSPTYITTSWDDGHPLDLRVADLLVKYGLTGTFYIPRNSDHETLSPGQIRNLASAFEIGAHTLNHVDLTALTDAEASGEIAGSKAWIEEITGRSCPMFCPPRGRFSGKVLARIAQAGFLGMRTVELLSCKFPRRKCNLEIMPTSVQAYPHGLRAYGTNAIKRLAIANLWRYVTRGRTTNWTVLARSLLCEAQERGGVFHLWGHSWEIQQASQWQRLEEVLQLMGQFGGRSAGRTNGQICQRASVAISSTTETAARTSEDNRDGVKKAADWRRIPLAAANTSASIGGSGK